MSQDINSNSPTTPSRIIKPSNGSGLGVNRISKPVHGFVIPKNTSLVTPTGILNPAIPDDCAEDPRQLGTGPQIYFAPWQGQAIGGALADLYIQLPFGCKVFFLGSIKTPQNSLYFHLIPLNKNYGGSNGVTVTGFEQWFPLTSFIVASGAQFYWSILRFKRPIQAFYLDTGNENGAANAGTIVCVKDEEEMLVGGGPWSS
jgi:hypothetical protein